MFKRLFNNLTKLPVRVGGDVAALEATDAHAQICVLFVCMGNICRSPTARAVFEKRVREAGLARAIQADAAGTSSAQVGNPPDRRAAAAALSRGYDLSRYRARRVAPDDLHRFDYIVVMDRENLDDMRQIATAEVEGKAKLLMEFAGAAEHDEVPDPYFGGSGGFERVLDLVEDAAQGLLQHIRTRHQL
jgi:protein-tyrosine phosphatase